MTTEPIVIEAITPEAVVDFLEFTNKQLTMERPDLMRLRYFSDLDTHYVYANLFHPSVDDPTGIATLMLSTLPNSRIPQWLPEGDENYCAPRQLG